VVIDFLQSIRKAAPLADIHYIQGNHERRLTKWLWSKGKDIASLDCLSIQKLLRLKEMGITYHTKGYKIGKLYMTHGSVIRKHAGYTARAEFEKNGCSGMSGHTHRDGKYTVRNRSGHFVWYENYCLCGLDPEYVEGIANWTQGISCVHLFKDSVRVEQIPFINGKYIYGGKMYS